MPIFTPARQLSCFCILVSIHAWHDSSLLARKLSAILACRNISWIRIKTEHLLSSSSMILLLCCKPNNPGLHHLVMDKVNGNDSYIWDSLAGLTLGSGERRPLLWPTQVLRYSNTTGTLKLHSKITFERTWNAPHLSLTHTPILGTSLPWFRT